MVPRLAIVCLSAELGFRQAHQNVAPFLEWLCTARSRFHWPRQSPYELELFVRMPISLCNQLFSNELPTVMVKRRTATARFLCLVTSVLWLGLPSDTLAGQQTPPDRLGHPRRNSASRSPGLGQVLGCRPTAPGTSSHRRVRFVKTQEPRFKRG